MPETCETLLRVDRHPKEPVIRGMKAFITYLILAGGLLLSGCATNPVTGKQDLVLMTEDQEISLGRRAHQDLMRQYRPYNDPELQNYVAGIVRDLSQQSHRKNLVFHVTVLDSPEINAFALPGGYIYITRGIMAYMNTEAELAGVLGHEIGHVTARHGVQQQSTGAVADLLGKGIEVLTGSQVASQAAGIGSMALIRGYGRKHELEADRLGAEYLARVGYDPKEMLSVVGILKSQEEFERKLAEQEGREPNIYHGVFATHPDNDTRFKEVVQAANKFKSPVARKVNREKFLGFIDGLPVGPSASDGVLRGHKFYHGDLDLVIVFPEGWKVDNRPDRLVAGPANRELQLQITVEDLNRYLTPREYLVQRTQGRLRQGKDIQTADFTGYTGRTSLNVKGTARPGRVAVLFQDTRIYTIAAIGENQSALDRHDSAVLSTVKSMRNLKGSERKLAEPQRIRLVRAKPGDTFASLADQSSLTNHPVEQLRLLNGMFPEGEPEPGQWVKLVR